MSSASDPTPDDPVVIFYWRPGCPFCMLLDRALQKRGVEVEKRNIWEDPDAAAAVRAVAGGNETVPTVVIGSTAMVNPSADQVVAARAAEAARG